MPDDPQQPAADPRLVRVDTEDDVLEIYRGTPVEQLILAQNCHRPFPLATKPSLMVATCIDCRVRLTLPPGAAFELRSAGVNLKQQAFFQIAFVVSVVGVRHVALISHDDCAMTALASSRQAFADGMTECAGWSATQADSFFAENAEFWGRDDAIATVIEDAVSLRSRLSFVTFAPLHYSVRDGRLAQIVETAR